MHPRPASPFTASAYRILPSTSGRTLRSLFLLPLFAACTTVEETPDTLPGDALGPAISLTTTHAQSNVPVTLTAAVGSPNKVVTFLASSMGVGPGPCPTVMRGACAGLRQPTVLGTATTDWAGIATFTYVLPSSDVAPQAAWQAVVLRGRQRAWTSNTVAQEVVGQADIHLAYGPTEQSGWHSELGYRSAGESNEIWWNDSEICLNGWSMGYYRPSNLAWEYLEPSYAWTGCQAVQFGYDTFVTVKEDGSMMVLQVTEDWDPMMEGQDLDYNHLGLKIYDHADTMPRAALPGFGGRGYIVREGSTTDPYLADLWWNNYEICATAVQVGTTTDPSTIDPGSYAALARHYDCYTVAEGGGEVFIIETLSGELAGVWVEPGYDIAEEAMNINDIALRIVR
jgi:hypothetical protein